MNSEKTAELRLNRTYHERRTVCGRCGGVFTTHDEDYTVCERCVKEALLAHGFRYDEEDIMAKYEDKLRLISEQPVFLESDNNVHGPMSLCVREFPGKGKYAFFAHIGPTLVDSVSGPIEEVQQAHDRAQEIIRGMGKEITWVPD